MHPARFWKKQEKNTLQCGLCPHNCVIAEGGSGICKARKNLKGELFSMVYGKPVAVNVDPVEKKPLYHFLLGSMSFSIGTVGCNLGCLHCQNWDIASAAPDEQPSLNMPPEDVVRLAAEKGCQSISYTYNEPTIFHEYAVDCAKLARKKGLKNIIVTNGFISNEAAEEFAEYMDAANVDLKALDEDFYKKICKAKLQPVLDTLKIYNKKLVLEITNLVIAGHNDRMPEIEKMCRWIAKELGRDTPLHFSRAFPMYKMQDMQATPEKTLLKAKTVAEKHLDYVYLGNVTIPNAGNTYCPECNELLVSREHYNTMVMMKGNRCSCGHEVTGMF